MASRNNSTWMQRKRRTENNNPEVLLRRIGVCPWYTKNEFDEVYDLIFGPNNCTRTRANALRKLRTWNTRKGVSTPASILATIEILKVKQCDTTLRTIYDYDGLQAMFSMAVLRFVNHMFWQSKNLNIKRTREIAKTLGLSPFIMKVRRTSLFGRDLLKLGKLRKAADECLDWVKKFYWFPMRGMIIQLNELKTRNQKLQKINLRINNQFKIYDIAVTAVMLGCETIEESENKVSTDLFRILKAAADKLKCNSDIVQIINAITVKMTMVFTGKFRFYDLKRNFFKGFFEMRSFFKMPEIFSGEHPKLMRLNRILFQHLTSNGIGPIQHLLYALIKFCENDSECDKKRAGANFWANKIIIDLIAKQEITLACNQYQYQHNARNFIHSEIVEDVKKQVYEKLQVDPGSTLNLDVPKNPEIVKVKGSYILERMQNINTYTYETVKKCLILSDPPLTEVQFDEITRRIDNYMAGQNHIKNDFIEMYGNIIAENDKILSLVNEQKARTSNMKTTGIWPPMEIIEEPLLSNRNLTEKKRKNKDEQQQ